MHSAYIRRLVTATVVLLTVACTRDPQRAGGTRTTASTSRVLGITQLASVPEIHRVWKGSSVNFEGRPSPDGRYISTMDYATGDLALRDLPADTARRLTAIEFPYADWAGFSAFAPDGRTVVFQWFTAKENRYELRTMVIAGPDSGRVQTIFTAPDIAMIWPQSFTPDGRSVATVIVRSDRTNQILLISLHGDAPKTLKSFDWRMPTDLAVSPDGNWLAYDFPPDQNEQARDVYVMALDGSRETAVLQHRDDDFVAGWMPDGSRLLVGSTRSGTPSVWALAMTAGKPQGAPVLVRSDMWRMVPLGAARNGSVFYGVLTGERDVFTAVFDAKSHRVVSEPTSVSGGATNTSPHTAAFSPDGQHVAYVLLRGPGTTLYGPADLVIRPIDGGEMRRLSPNLASIRHVQWLPDGRSLLLQGSDHTGRPGLFRFALGSGALTPLYQSTGGFTAAVTRDGAHAFVTKRDSSLSVVSVDLVTGRQSTIYTTSYEYFFGIAVSPDGRQVALALRNQEPGTSTIQIVRSDGGASRELVRLPPTEQMSPYARLAWSPDGRDVYFGASRFDPQRMITSEIRRAPVAGGEPQPIGLTGGALTSFQISPDGRHVSFGVDDFMAEVWVMAPPVFSPARLVVGKR